MKSSVSSLAWGLLLCVSACAKKEPKPLRTEPWLAHPPASASASSGSDAAVPAVRYALTEPSVIRFELPTKRGALRGSLTRVSGELSLDTSDLGRSRARIDADLGSLTVQSADGSDDAWRARALSALELSDAGTPNARASFELTALEDAAPPLLEPAPPISDGGPPFTRRVRATALGNLLLHGFRVLRRAPVEVELGYGGDRSSPSTILIRSRAPFVVSLETHAIRAVGPESAGKSESRTLERSHEVRVSVELYARKID